jgi:ABC-type Na+ transport system ATPase subunit NatA
VTRDKKPAVTLFFDKTTGLLAKSETKVKDEFQGFKEVTQETYFSDYKDANGKKLFGKMKIVRDGKTMIESTLSEQKAPEKLDPKLFEKP